MTIETAEAPQRSISDDVKTWMWARDLSNEQLSRVKKDLVERHVPTGQYVCRAGEAVDQWIGVAQGLVKLGNLSQHGKWTTFTGVTAGGWFGEGSMLKTEPRRYSAVALRDTRLACIPRSTFNWLLECSMPFNRFLLNHINERCGQIIAMLDSDRLLEPDARTARCLSALFNPYLYPGITNKLDICQEEMGHLSGMSRQHVHKALHTLERKGLLVVGFRSITVTDLEGLRSYGR